MTVKLNKWGNSLGLRIPKIIAEEAQLKPGSEFILSVNKNGSFNLTLKEDDLTLDDLVKGVTPENRHDNLIEGEIGNEVWKY